MCCLREGNYIVFSSLSQNSIKVSLFFQFRNDMEQSVIKPSFNRISNQNTTFLPTLFACAKSFLETSVSRQDKRVDCSTLAISLSESSEWSYASAISSSMKSSSSSSLPYRYKAWRHIYTGSYSIYTCGNSATWSRSLSSAATISTTSSC